MAYSRTSLGSFLRHAKSGLASAIAKGDKVKFVIGNESADLDSLTSSLLLAYIRSTAPPANASSRIYYPVLNIPARDIELRPEFLALLPHANVDPGSLITLDDLRKRETSPFALAPQATSWILVDHNALQGSLGSVYSARVIGCIDHHEDEHQIPDDTGDEPRIIKKSGSCTSLVTNYCQGMWDKISADASTSNEMKAGDDAASLGRDAASSSLWDTQVAKLAIASILIDTNNLRDKVTEHDVLAVKYLESKIIASQEGSKSYSRDQFFKEISEAKQNIGQLKLHDILRKDYKEWTEGGQVLGISSVVKDIDFLVEKAAQEGSGGNKFELFVQAVDSFAKDRGLGLYAIMTTSTSPEGEFQRELFVSATNAQTVEAAAKFVNHSATELGLAKWRGPVDGVEYSRADCWRRIWQQNNVAHSRKRVAPLLRDAMKSEDTEGGWQKQ
ncbi:uncharacterized protein PV09_02204 [Verruconis gallopava]|uniref:DHHA2 domain-containing protein n=1 Tax=Verruconis gallopava TaxID=253628 RepID=A0A0D2AKI3_9PEZI|nr:uncharacterized protein PV09_02204 [Verruconis gallopava]KIW07358.1 hypothetical protein PV09_02204 [Verruconis gallopava]